MNSEDTTLYIFSSHADGGGDSQCGQSQRRAQVVDDNSDVEVIEKPPNFVPRARKKARMVDGVLNNECCILYSNPDHIVATSEISVNDSDEVIVTGESGQVACRDYPHSRDHCVKFPFKSTPHEKHCGLCHCYVCDELAPCLSWGKGNSSSDHCHASDKEEKWKTLRHSCRLGKTQMVSSTTSMATNKLLTMMSQSHMGRSNTVGTGAITSVPLIISNDAVPLVCESNQRQNFPSTNTLNIDSWTRLAYSCNASPHVPRRNERIARTRPAYSSDASPHVPGRNERIARSRPAYSSDASPHVPGQNERIARTRPAYSSDALPHVPGQNEGIARTVSVYCNVSPLVPGQIERIASTRPTYSCDVPPHVPGQIERIASTRPTYSCDVPPHVPGQNERIAETGNVPVGSMGFSGHVNKCQLAGGSFPSNISCDITQSIGLTQFSPCSSSRNLNFPVIVNPVCGFTNVPGQLASYRQRQVPDSSNHGPGTVATPGSQTGLIEGSQMQRGESFNALLSMNEQSQYHWPRQIARFGRSGRMVTRPIGVGMPCSSFCDQSTMTTGSHGSQVGLVVGNNMQRMDPLTVLSVSNESSMPHVARHILRLGQLGSMVTGPMQRDASNTVLHTAATRSHGSQEGSVEDNQMELLNVSSSSNSQGTMEICSRTPQLPGDTYFSGEVNLNGIHSMNASSLQSETVVAKLKMLREILLGSDSEHNLCVQNGSLTDIFSNSVMDPCSNSEMLSMAQSGASGYTPYLSSTCGLHSSSRPDFLENMESIISLPANEQMPNCPTVVEETIELQTNVPGN